MTTVKTHFVNDENNKWEEGYRRMMNYLYKDKPWKFMDYDIEWDPNLFEDN